MQLSMSHCVSYRMNKDDRLTYQNIYSTCTNISPMRYAQLRIYGVFTSCISFVAVQCWFSPFSDLALLLHSGESLAEILKHSGMSEKTRLLPEKDHTSRTEQDDVNNDAQGTSPSTGGTKATSVTMSQWRKLSFTVMTLLAYMFLNAGISMITPFYAIVVSFNVCMASMHGH